MDKRVYNVTTRGYVTLIRLIIIINIIIYHLFYAMTDSKA